MPARFSILDIGKILLSPTAVFRAVAEEFKRGVQFPEPTTEEILARRSSTGGIGNLPLKELRARYLSVSRWTTLQRNRFNQAMTRLAGRGR